MIVHALKLLNLASITYRADVANPVPLQTLSTLIFFSRDLLGLILSA